jgi:hypothetical protein
MRGFIEERSKSLKDQQINLQNLLPFYVGHGLLWGVSNTYSFVIRATDEHSEGLTSIRVSDLAASVNDYGRFLRKFIILDCCFSASAYREFQSGPLTASRVKLMDELPKRGTSLLCSIS